MKYVTLLTSVTGIWPSQPSFLSCSRILWTSSYRSARFSQRCSPCLPPCFWVLSGSILPLCCTAYTSVTIRLYMHKLAIACGRTLCDFLVTDSACNLLTRHAKAAERARQQLWCALTQQHQVPAWDQNSFSTVALALSA